MIASIVLASSLCLADPYYFKTKSPELLLNAMTPMTISKDQLRVQANVCEKVVGGTVYPFGGNMAFVLNKKSKAFDVSTGKPIAVSMKSLFLKNSGNFVFHCVPAGTSKYRVIAVYR